MKNRLLLDDESYTIILNTACEPEKVPEELRAFSDYRMLVYAVVLIAVMLLTNSVAIKNFFSSLRTKGREKSGKKEGEAV